MSKAVRMSISMPAALHEKAKAREQSRHFGTFSDYIQDLIRNDCETHGLLMRDAPSSQPSTSALPTPAPKPAEYPKVKRKRKHRFDVEEEEAPPH